MQLCSTPGCIYEGKYCRIHKEQKPKGKVSKRPDLVEWYAKKIKSCDWICCECGKSCYSSNKDYQFAAQAHILPKSLFPSVATHEQNYMCLGPACGCHGKYDSNWDNASKMKVWPEALSTMFTLIPLLPVQEYRKLPDIVRVAYENKKLSTDCL